MQTIRNGTPARKMTESKKAGETACPPTPARWGRRFRLPTRIFHRISRVEGPLQQTTKIDRLSHAPAAPTRQPARAAPPGPGEPAPSPTPRSQQRARPRQEAPIPAGHPGQRQQHGRRERGRHRQVRYAHLAEGQPLPPVARIRAGEPGGAAPELAPREPPEEDQKRHRHGGDRQPRRQVGPQAQPECARRSSSTAARVSRTRALPTAAA